MLVLLDRDGVINVDLKPHGTTTLEALNIYPFALEAISLLKQAGIKVAVVTNQSAIGKGLMDEVMLGIIHQEIQTRLAAHGAAIDAFYYCADHPDNPTHRRKPDDGMIQEALADFGVGAKDTVFIGDSLRDMQAAHKAGCPRYLVATGNGEQAYAQLSDALRPIHYCANILDAVRHILLEMDHGKVL